MKIAVLPGDGIGPEIIKQAVKVIKALGLEKNIEYLYKNKDFRDSCAKAGKQRMIDHFKVEEMINKHIRLYENTINER